MTFTELITTVQNRLNLSSSESTTRIGDEINDYHRRITSTLGLNITRRATVSSAIVVGAPTVTFAVEKITNVIDRNYTPHKILSEVTMEEMRGDAPFVNAAPLKYGISAYGPNSVTITIDCVTTTARTLFCDGYVNLAILSGNMSPVFPESFHDVLKHGVLADEYRKMEKVALAKDAEGDYERRLSDLRMFLAKSVYLDLMQNGTGTASVPVYLV
mgnify:CR=1 FL=1